MSDTPAAAIIGQWHAYRTQVRRMLLDLLDDGVRAQALEGDRTSGHATVLDENGDPMPAVSDPTGETAIAPDRARRLLAELDQAERDLKRVAELFNRCLGETVFAAKPSFQRHIASDGEPGCESCARLKVKGVPWWNPPDYNSGKPTDLAGELPRRMLLCRACERFAAAQTPTRLPNPKELAVKRDTGHWPKRHEKAA